MSYVMTDKCCKEVELGFDILSPPENNVLYLGSNLGKPNQQSEHIYCIQYKPKSRTC